MNIQSTPRHLRANARAFVLSIAIACVALMCFGAAAQAADWPRPGFSETAATQNPKFPSVTTTAVTVEAPLPASFGSRPAACDTLTFIRIKRAAGPLDPADADTVLVAQPGVLEGASAFLNVGSNLVQRAWSENGKNAEFWAVDRRPNCLEDVNGLKWANASGDPVKLIDYYYRGGTFMGQQFEGFLDKSSPKASWLKKMGMDQTLRDWNEIITRGVPELADRQQKVYCGGHSLGGIITGQYSNYDFDGNPGTLGDAGFNQCRGYFGLDTLVTDDPLKLRQLGPALGLDSLTGAVTGLSDAAIQNGLIAPFVDIPGTINPEVMYLLTGVGAAARLQPTIESNLVDELPANANVRTAYRVYFSRNLTGFISGSPGLADFRMTNQVLLGTFMDDNSMPLGIVQTSVGFFDGGPVADKNFPIPNVIGSLPGFEWLTRGILGTGSLAIPTDYGRKCFFVFCWYEPGTGPLYKWRNYNQIPGASIAKSSSGRPFTTAAEEVADINDLALSLSAMPANFIEAYFPMKLQLDSMLALAGSQEASPGAIHSGGVAMRPSINVIAGGGPVKGIAALLSPESPVIPGYQHLDVLTAAPSQTNGNPEQTVSELLGFLY